MADSKTKGVTVKAVRNIPISMCASSEEIPARLKRHPGGARVERGTEITVSKDTADTLKKAGYAE